MPVDTFLEADTLYLRCEDASDVAGVYQKVQAEGNEPPLWKLKHEGSPVNDRWLSLHRNDCGPSSPRLNWKTPIVEKVYAWLLTKNRNEWLEGPWAFHSTTSSSVDSGTDIHDKPIWIRKGRVQTGMILSLSEKPKLDTLAEIIWNMKGRVDTIVYAQQRETFKRTLDEMLVAVGQATKQHYMATRNVNRLSTRYVDTFFPDVKLQVGDELLQVSSKILVSGSHFFAKLLDESCNMCEASTGIVKLPTGNPRAIRHLLAILSSDTISLKDFDIASGELAEVFAQAAEWECNKVVEMLASKVKNRISSLEAQTSLEMLKMIALHTAASNKPPWTMLLEPIIERVAETREGDFTSLHGLTPDVVSRVLKCDKLETCNDEGRVLKFVVDWSKENGIEHLPMLLNAVRFPQMRLMALRSDEKAALKFIQDHAEEQLDALLGEATCIQTGVKRPSDFSEDVEALQRAQKRSRCNDCSQLKQEELGKLLRESILSSTC